MSLPRSTSLRRLIAIGAFAIVPLLVGTGAVAAAGNHAVVLTAARSVVGTVRWTTVSVQARQSPSAVARPLFTIPAGTPVRVRRTFSGQHGVAWYLVTTVGWSGWIGAGHTSPALTVAEDEVTTWDHAHASSYGVGDGLIGSDTTCGGHLTTSLLAVATAGLPCGTVVVLRSGGRTVSARVLDRRPMPAGISFDLAPAVCTALRSCSGDIPIQWHVER